MSSIELKSVADVQKAMADLTEKVQSKASADDITKAVEPLTKALQKQRGEFEQVQRDLQNRAISNGRDADVTRAFVPGDREAKALHNRRIVESPRGLSRAEGKVYLGNGDGVIKMLGHVDECGDYEHGLLDDPNPKNEWHHELQKTVTDIGFCRLMGVRPEKSSKRLSKLMRRAPESIAKVWADNATEGAEFIEDVLVPDLIRELRLPTGGVASLFQRTTSRAGGTTTNPFLTTGVQPFIVGNPALGDMDPATIERSVPKTDERTHTPSTWGINVPSFMDAEEDSVIEWGSLARAEIASAFRDGEEDAILNGDTGTHGDTGLATWAGPNSRWQVLGSNNDHRKTFIGLRHRAIDISSAASETAAQTVTGTMLWRSNLNVAHKTMGGLAYIMPLDFLIAKLLTDSNFLTIDKYGQMATLLTGEVGRIGGVPVVVSEYMSNELNTSGIYDGSTTTKTGGLLVNTGRFQIVQRRGPMVTLESRPTQHTNYLVASVRQTFRSLDGSSTKNVYYGYNLDK